MYKETPKVGEKLKCTDAYPLMHIKAGDVYTVAEVDAREGREVSLRFEETPEGAWYHLCRFRKPGRR